MFGAKRKNERIIEFINKDAKNNDGLNSVSNGNVLK